MNGREYRKIIERERSRLHAETRGDLNLALELAIHERLVMSGMVSVGYARVGSGTATGPFEVPPCIEDPTPEDQTSADA